ncbi:hypothetical protein B0H13DRAFT_1853671 [Mycena leptocephala]|nr:hypothetical protein B0H13DRAFT_1853671 [Mycena leptocephala]
MPVSGSSGLQPLIQQSQICNTFKGRAKPFVASKPMGINLSLNPLAINWPTQDFGAIRVLFIGFHLKVFFWGRDSQLGRPHFSKIAVYHGRGATDLEKTEAPTTKTRADCEPVHVVHEGNPGTVPWAGVGLGESHSHPSLHVVEGHPLHQGNQPPRTQIRTVSGSQDMKQECSAPGDGHEEKMYEDGSGSGVLRIVGETRNDRETVTKDVPKKKRGRAAKQAPPLANVTNDNASEASSISTITNNNRTRARQAAAEAKAAENAETEKARAAQMAKGWMPGLEEGTVVILGARKPRAHPDGTLPPRVGQASAARLHASEKALLEHASALKRKAAAAPSSAKPPGQKKRKV